MLLLIIAFAAFVLAFILEKFVGEFGEPGPFTFLLGVALLVGLLAIFPMRANSKSYAINFESTRATVTALKRGGIENTGISKLIIEKNADLAETKYWANNSFTSIFYTDAIRNLQPIDINSPQP